MNFITRAVICVAIAGVNALRYPIFGFEFCLSIVGGLLVAAIWQAFANKRQK